MDIMEMVNGAGTWYGTYHWQSAFPTANCTFPQNHGSLGASHPLPDFATTFHEFAVERGSDHVAFVLDGAVMVNITKKSPAGHNPSPPLALPWPTH